jgi:UDP-N-acetylmuramoyl-L-alanyl-D-glutamate--2,6-diaminopimelate ligase
MTPPPHALTTLTDGMAEMQQIAGPRDLVITDLTADSRQVKPGMLFAAFPGGLADGRDYIPAALAAGACAILVP